MTQREAIAKIKKYKGPVCVTMLVGEGTLMVQCVKADLVRELEGNGSYLGMPSSVSLSIDRGMMFVHPEHNCYRHGGE